MKRSVQQVQLSKSPQEEKKQYIQRSILERIFETSNGPAFLVFQYTGTALDVFLKLRLVNRDFYFITPRQIVSLQLEPWRSLPFSGPRDNAYCTFLNQFPCVEKLIITQLTVCQFEEETNETNETKQGRQEEMSSKIFLKQGKRNQVFYYNNPLRLTLDFSTPLLRHVSIQTFRKRNNGTRLTRLILRCTSPVLQTLTIGETPSFDLPARFQISFSNEAANSIREMTVPLRCLQSILTQDIVFQNLQKLWLFGTLNGKDSILYISSDVFYSKFPIVEDIQLPLSIRFDHSSSEYTNIVSKCLVFSAHLDTFPSTGSFFLLQWLQPHIIKQLQIHGVDQNFVSEWQNITWSSLKTLSLEGDFSQFFTRTYNIPCLEELNLVSFSRALSPIQTLVIDVPSAVLLKKVSITANLKYLLRVSFLNSPKLENASLTQSLNKDILSFTNTNIFWPFVQSPLFQFQSVQLLKLSGITFPTDVITDWLIIQEEKALLHLFMYGCRKIPFTNEKEYNEEYKEKYYLPVHMKGFSQLETLQFSKCYFDKLKLTNLDNLQVVDTIDIQSNRLYCKSLCIARCSEISKISLTMIGSMKRLELDNLPKLTRIELISLHGIETRQPPKMFFSNLPQLNKVDIPWLWHGRLHMCYNNQDWWKHVSSSMINQ